MTATNLAELHARPQAQAQAAGPSRCSFIASPVASSGEIVFLLAATATAKAARAALVPGRALLLCASSCVTPVRTNVTQEPLAFRQRASAMQDETFALIWAKNKASGREAICLSFVCRLFATIKNKVSRCALAARAAAAAAERASVAARCQDAQARRASRRTAGGSRPAPLPPRARRRTSKRAGQQVSSWAA